MMQFELTDIIFLVKSIKSPSSHFNIMDYFAFSSCGTRSSLTFNLNFFIISLNLILPASHLYFRRIPPLWNSPTIDLNLRISTIIVQLKISSGTSYNWSFILRTHVLFSLFVHAINVPVYMLTLPSQQKAVSRDLVDLQNSYDYELLIRLFLFSGIPAVL